MTKYLPYTLKYVAYNSCDNGYSYTCHRAKMIINEPCSLKFLIATITINSAAFTTLVLQVWIGGQMRKIQVLNFLQSSANHKIFNRHYIPKKCLTNFVFNTCDDKNDCWMVHKIYEQITLIKNLQLVCPCSCMWSGCHY